MAEKGRLAHENSIYARENRFLREIVEYHQLTMQDVVYLDEGTEEVTQVYPFSVDDAKLIPSTPTSPIFLDFFPEVSTLSLPPNMKEHSAETPKEVLTRTSSLLSASSPSIKKSNKAESSEISSSTLLVDGEETNALCHREAPTCTNEP